MRDRYLSLPGAIIEDEQVRFTTMHINPFSIDGYYESSVEYPDENEEWHEIFTVRVVTRMGFEFDVLMSIEDFESQIFR